jgi:hypothetical protein
LIIDGIGHSFYATRYFEHAEMSGYRIASLPVAGSTH